ncbi:acyl carrier protein [Campylobacter canadensis]|uniref:Acyl carrier protein n=2 Tax=Campylobacter canadensis TaxID=449520 RepID=A0ABS7WSJ5_9BACT|nr:acyl carrier protein [Campylobacter canadensis]MBZ7994370.1 acyl carrier protein [Campylobacter canadensis]MBZ7996067.1 acyl carrier protein [Campylobacter canadensis]MBZ7998279.1 acyl carrier protein [Campylobacter canadensis]MBZ7999703.1 acyl carrier protein [Campylobacter canadensis]
MYFDSVKKLIAKELGVEEESIKPESKISEDLGADSLDVVELILGIEEEFQISIPDEDAQKISTVQDIVDYIKEHK